ncbi:MULTISPECIES: TraR/DksA C4-type zinc finger protein [unclassified Streptomyces]|jgi:RNA polymerase-binding transcription factor DksA|uniref:TraR/DksA C4-type zinc finger protein n=1 Tax=unclassified Streptomyces TaxID=2593676 RepID=UPI0004C0B6CE|nr:MULTISPECIES: TraR/DksA C4-type zinc finger protein [unclassified Streptomyces]
MSLDTARAGSSAGRLSMHEARQRLEHERNARLAQLEALREGQGDAVADDLVSAQRMAVRRALKDIDAAFGRLEDGSYGVCGGCAKPIPVERLEILPYAGSCVPCAQRAD